jgi:nucleoside triphosphatase
MTNQRPKIAVGALVFNKEGKLFLGKCDSKWDGKWIVPGGHVEWGETIHDAMVRELKEETDLDATSCEYFWLQECIFPKEFHKEMHFIFPCFICKVDSTDVTLNDEFDGHTWVTLDEALNMDVNASSKKFIKEYIRRKK